MIKTGLVSVTFREFSAEQIVKLASQAGLVGIDWGGDIHVPHGDIETAGKVRQITKDAGLEVACYGSYYRIGESNAEYRIGKSDDEGLSFESVLETAKALGAPTIRVWAGGYSSCQADEEYRQLIVSQSRRIANMAGKAGIAIAYEFHKHTLTDTAESARRLLEDVSHDNVSTLWQTTNGASEKQNLAGLEKVLPWVSNIHVFYWGKDNKERYLISDGADSWKKYFKKILTNDIARYAMIEFVKDGSVENFLKDVQTLNSLLDLN